MVNRLRDAVGTFIHVIGLLISLLGCFIASPSGRQKINDRFTSAVDDVAFPMEERDNWPVERM